MPRRYSGVGRRSCSADRAIGGLMRPDDPDPRLVHAVVDRVFHPDPECQVERVTEGVSTFVYRIRRGAEAFYLRILPEVDASFAPEVRALQLLRQRGVRVPEVVYWEHRDALLGRSVMVTTEIAGRHVGRRTVDGATRQILFEAGQQLALLNTVPVTGFGWVRRDRGEVVDLEGEHPTLRAFVYEHLEADLAALERERLLNRDDAVAIRGIVEAHPSWLDAEQGQLAHGDFDVTQIYQQDGRYTGIIDFGEIRGADRWYDLGHFRMHDGETLPELVLDWLLEGYRSAVPLPADHRRRISFASLLIAVRAFARCLERRPEQAERHQGRTSIARDLARLLG
jgi:aminoglycoside phosphotransferase (APT) family kinase protein